MRVVLTCLTIVLLFAFGCTKSEVNPPAVKEQKAVEKTEQQAHQGDDAQQQDVLNSLIDRVK